MTVRLILNGLTVIILLSLYLFACGQSSRSNLPDEKRIANADEADFDTLNTAIIPFDQKGNYPFNNSYQPATLTSVEIQKVDSLLAECMMNYNNSLEKAHKNFSIDLSKKDYKKQLIAVTNKNGDKEVWVNILCDTWGRDWHKDVLLVKDGGNCYFNFKVNLTKKKYYDLSVNGEA